MMSSFGSHAAVPIGTEASSELLAKRIVLFSKLLACVSATLMFVGNIHRVVFLGGPFFYRGNLATLTAMLLQLATWQAARRLRTSARVLSLVEAAMLIGTLCTLTVHVRLIAGNYGYSADLLMVLASCILLATRAAVIPSTPRSTFIVGVLGSLPGAALAFWVGAASGKGAQAVTFAIILGGTAVAMTTFTSRVIYGLRQKAALARQLGQYVIERKIGQGGMGEVYLARHTMLRRPTALKLLPADRAGQETTLRFEREVRETSCLSHPNTVAIYDYGRTQDGVFYYAMEYLEGADLELLVKRQGPLPASRVVHILAQISGALAEAHARGLVHRDMKPANVILCERGGVKDTVKVVDFGLVKHVSTGGGDVQRTDVNVLVGTPAYMAPEAVHSPDLVDGRSDLYGVGAIGYFLLTGKMVFEAPSVVEMCAAHLHKRPVAPSERAKRELPADLEALIMQCLEKERDARPASAQELRKALCACDVPVWSADDAESVAFCAEPRSGPDSIHTIEIDLAPRSPAVALRKRRAERRAHGIAEA